MDTAQILTMAVAVFIPVLNGLLTKYNSSVGRVYLGIVLSAVNGLLVEWLAAVNDANEDFNLTQAALGALLSLVTAIAVQAGAWAPLGVSEVAKRSGVGAASAPAQNHLRGA